MTISKVIDNGFCIGCGACKVASEEAVNIEFTKGIYQAQIIDIKKEKVISKVCPFSDDSADEDKLASSLETRYHHDYIGKYNQLFAGKVTSDNQRVSSSSGGMLTHTLVKLFESGKINRVLHVKTSDTEYGFEFSESTTIADINKKTKSKYAPVSLSSIIEELKQDNGFTAITGVPCFIKAIGLLEKENIIDPIKYKLALFCGHYKTSHYGELLSWNSGVAPDELSSVDFRVKNNGKNAIDYYVEAVDKNENSHLGRVSMMFGSNWGHGFFKPLACEFCDDICGEVADATYGDAWLPEFMHDSLGTNIVITRNSDIDSLFKNSLAKEEIWLKDLSVDELFSSQAANFRHRRGGAIHRKNIIKSWTPKVRNDVCLPFASHKKERVYKYRLELSAKSIEVFESSKRKGSIFYFKIKMLPTVFAYEIENMGFKKGLLGCLKSLYKAFFNAR
ncbi:Coenzyme F420 hydrogenase [Vibrio crassostreae]|uniref:Coenzyme F420 hydrogenase/dehydrogenase, beta subunit C-terminal domain n=1 Tax=Vibrio crassostreae TaxID=246167 RepID=UPI00104A84F8|nr:Coenzyme F420 hydrogenase/dehydrogenase, beta subunit C-terminal domain [Vibrio crassostreae]TCN85196.1 coenzyme F420-reducing hydrogenase beta subunit [Vibrio crassostreae]CAK3029638.1 Coenzyme F420 hydrogenase [Vibrio crassostreae]